MTFSGSPQIVTLKGKTLAEKAADALKAEWGNNTSLELAFMRVLEIALDFSPPPPQPSQYIP